MHCSACSGAVEAALAAVPGVQSASVSLVMRRATVITDPTAVSPVRLHDPVVSSRHPPCSRSTSCLCGMRFRTSIAWCVLDSREAFMHVVHSLHSPATTPYLLQAQLVEAVEDTGFEASILRQGASSDTVQLRVDGMTCGSCSAAVEKAVRAAPGVLTASVNLIAGTAEVRRQRVRRCMTVNSCHTLVVIGACVGSLCGRLGAKRATLVTDILDGCYAGSV